MKQSCCLVTIHHPFFFSVFPTCSLSPLRPHSGYHITFSDLVSLGRSLLEFLRHSLVWMILIICMIICHQFWISLRLDLTWSFSCDHLELCFLGEEGHRGQVLFTVPPVNGTCPKGLDCWWPKWQDLFSFLRLSDMPRCVYVCYTSLSIHVSMDIQAALGCILAIVSDAAMNIEITYIFTDYYFHFPWVNS